MYIPQTKARINRFFGIFPSLPPLSLIALFFRNLAYYETCLFIWKKSFLQLGALFLNFSVAKWGFTTKVFSFEKAYFILISLVCVCVYFIAFYLVFLYDVCCKKLWQIEKIVFLKPKHFYNMYMNCLWRIFWNIYPKYI